MHTTSNERTNKTIDMDTHNELCKLSNGDHAALFL